MLLNLMWKFCLLIQQSVLLGATVIKAPCALNGSRVIVAVRQIHLRVPCTEPVPYLLLP